MTVVLVVGADRAIDRERRAALGDEHERRGRRLRMPAARRPPEDGRLVHRSCADCSALAEHSLPSTFTSDSGARLGRSMRLMKPEPPFGAEGDGRQIRTHPMIARRRSAGQSLLGS
jgi:hypothetical protein